VNEAERLLNRVKEAERHLGAGFLSVVDRRLVEILVGTGKNAKSPADPETGPNCR
jgi:hypothetical protein